MQYLLKDCSHFFENSSFKRILSEFFAIFDQKQGILSGLWRFPLVFTALAVGITRQCKGNIGRILHAAIPYALPQYAKAPLKSGELGEICYRWDQIPNSEKGTISTRVKYTDPPRMAAPHSATQEEATRVSVTVALEPSCNVMVAVAAN